MDQEASSKPGGGEEQILRLVDDALESTQTIDLDRMFSGDVTLSGSFDLREIEATSLGKLLQAMPIPSLLTNRSRIVTFVNRATARLSDKYEQIKGRPFTSLFRNPEEAATVRSLINEVFSERKPQVHEGSMEFDRSTIWGRIHFRPIRIAQERLALVLVEDLTFEKQQLVLTQSHKEELRKAHAELEARVRERTAKLRNINDQLVREIAERELAEKELQRDKDRIDALLNTTTDLAYLLRADGGFLAMNRAGAQQFGRPIDQLLGENAYHLLPKRAAKKIKSRFDEIIRTGEAKRFELERKGIVFDMSAHPVRGLQGEVDGIAVFARDITNRKRIEQRLRLSANIMESVNEGILVTDPSGTIQYVNQAFVKLTGYEREEVAGKNPRIMKSDRHGSQFYKDMWESLRDTGRWQGEIWDRRKSGEVYPKLLSITALKDSAGQVLHYVGIFSDITRIKRTEKRLRRLAHYDPLTNLPNRVLFRDRLQQALFHAAREHRMLALIYLDLDGFKKINDTMGHRIGDDALVEVSGRLTGSLRKGDTVARMGGDEFTVIVSGLSSMGAIAEVARKITDEMSKPFLLEGRKAFCTISAGIAVYPDDGSDVDTLLQNADTAMYHAKEEGRNRFAFFSEEMNVAVGERLELESALRTALEGNELYILYQPIVNLQSGTICAVEALLRWQRPDSRLLLPDTFVPLAEETGLIVAMSHWVIRRACEEMLQLHAQGLPLIPVAVNVAGPQLKEKDFPETLMNIVQTVGMDPSYVGLEMAESVMMGDLDANLGMFQQLKELGFRIMVDDFGSGGSALLHLKRASLESVKIHKSFISAIESDPDSESVVSAVISLAHSLGLKVVAEGVENEEQLNVLRNHNCDQWQGDYFSPPVTAHQLVPFLTRVSDPS